MACFSAAYLPLLTWAYCRIKEIEFTELDTGVNSHKWVVLAAYLIYVLFWLLLNRYLELFCVSGAGDDPNDDLAACVAGGSARPAPRLAGGASRSP